MEEAHCTKEPTGESHIFIKLLLIVSGIQQEKIIIMDKLLVVVLCLVAAVLSKSIDAEPTPSGFIYLGSSTNARSGRASQYYLSSPDALRTVSEARTDCDNQFRGSELLAIENSQEDNTIRKQLSTWNIGRNDRVWTSGEYLPRDQKWVWYSYASGTSNVVYNYWDIGCPREWNGSQRGCIAVGGRDLEWGWKDENCDTKRRFVCEIQAQLKNQILHP